ncbi:MULTISPECIES: hypothetical protein [Microbacterium]|uniref:Lipoprotein n=1 Tax=Microbacterium trichothecenolyticum TaxID=69370 RepID=A0A0M2HE34_MICTR|nr:MULTISPECIES: hypothetical protein [Microbacterium]KJL42448.1 hypothetical protein RS82_02004 [Microbacterium trichothecenolyticum]MDR7190195.1 hypothetical protein [Microbacterium sp. BE35]
MTTRVTAAVLSGLLALALAGCTTPEPVEPTPTPAFSSEEEAFAAAEETYRAYVDALNARHADPAATPSPTDFLIGQALESELDTQSILAEQERSIVGDAEMTRFAGTNFANDLGEVTAVVCLDVSNSRVVDSDGTDVTPSDRPPVLALEIVFTPINDGLAVSASAVADDQTC